MILIEDTKKSLKRYFVIPKYLDPKSRELSHDSLTQLELSQMSQL